MFVLQIYWGSEKPYFKVKALKQYLSLVSFSLSSHPLPCSSKKSQKLEFLLPKMGHRIQSPLPSNLAIKAKLLPLNTPPIVLERTLHEEVL